MIKAEKTVLDISYSISGDKLTIQVVLLEGTTLSDKRIENMKIILPQFVISIEELLITKEQFNESKGEWQPKYYKWLDYLLYSKAEII